MRGQDVSVTGLGMVTPAGDGWPAAWERVCAGQPTGVLGPAEPVAHLACVVDDLDATRLGGSRSRKPDRCTQLALLAAREAVADAGLDGAGWDGARVAVVMGSASGGSGTLEAEYRTLSAQGVQDMSPYALPSSLSNSVSAQLAIEFAATGPSYTISSACASGTTAIGVALDLLALGHCDIVLAGGAEAALTPFNIAAYDRLGALSHRFDDPAGASRPFDARRDGFVIGEGAGVLVLERTVDAHARGARTRARIMGFGASSDAHHVVKPSPDGAGLATAIRRTLARSGAMPEDVSHINAHATGTPLGDRVEAAVLADLFPHRPAVTSTKGVTGHLLGAAGAVEAALTVLAVEQGRIPPTANLDDLDPAVALDVPTKCREQRLPLALSVSTGFGGQNAVLAIALA